MIKKIVKKIFNLFGVRLIMLKKEEIPKEFVENYKRNLKQLEENSGEFFRWAIFHCILEGCFNGGPRGDVMHNLPHIGGSNPSAFCDLRQRAKESPSGIKLDQEIAADEYNLPVNLILPPGDCCLHFHELHGKEEPKEHREYRQHEHKAEPGFGEEEEGAHSHHHPIDHAVEDAAVQHLSRRNFHICHPQFLVQIGEMLYERRSEAG